MNLGDTGGIACLQSGVVVCFCLLFVQDMLWQIEMKNRMNIEHESPNSRNTLAGDAAERSRTSCLFLSLVLAQVHSGCLLHPGGAI